MRTEMKPHLVLRYFEHSLGQSRWRLCRTTMALIIAIHPSLPMLKSLLGIGATDWEVSQDRKALHVDSPGTTERTLKLRCLSECVVSDTNVLTTTRDRSWNEDRDRKKPT